METPRVTVFPVHATSVPLGSPVKRYRRIKHGNTFDPDELCRRLEVYQQEEHDARRRRRARTEQRSLKQAYHHTPVVAAVDFARTATPELRDKKDIHKLSRPVLQRGIFKKTGGPLFPVQFVQQQERARLNMEAAAERNQFQLTKILEDALASDKAREINKSQQRDFDLALLTTKPRSKALRDPSTSPEDIIASDLSVVGRDIPPKQNFFVRQPNDRHDWGQRDECAEGGRPRLDGGKVPLPRCGNEAYISSNSKVRRAMRMHEREILVDGAVAKKLPRRTSHIMLRSLFKRH